MDQSTTIIKDTTANPAPLGLLAFGLTTVLLNLHNAGIFEMNSMILAMGIFYGGIAQIIAGNYGSSKKITPSDSSLLFPMDLLAYIGCADRDA